MLSDFNTTTAVTTKESTYRLKALQRPTLIFDTYSYIHLPADPNASVSGGVQGQGLKSDFEFAILDISANSITLEGTVNKNKVIMTRLTQAQETALLAGGYKTTADANAGYLAANKFPYLQFSDNVKLAVSMDPVQKTFSLTYADASDVSKTLSATFAFGLTGFTLSAPITYNGNTFSEVLYDTATKQYYVVVGGTRYNFLVSATPVIPFRVVFGAGKDFSQIAYNPQVSPTNSVVIATGLSVDWASKYATSKTGLAAVGGAGRVLDFVNVIFPIDAPTQMILRFYYHNTANTNFQANMTYSFTRNANGEYDFTYLSSDGNAGVVGAGLVSIKDYFDLNVFRTDWVGNPGPGSAYGGLYVVSNPSSFFYGTLVK